MTVAIPSLKPLHETHSVAFEGAVDADGHILEPPDLRESYIDPKFRNRALRIVVDEDGLEELEIDGKRSSMSRKGFPATLGSGSSQVCWRQCSGSVWVVARSVKVKRLSRPSCAAFHFVEVEVVAHVFL
jgi:hypothetical protein